MKRMTAKREAIERKIRKAKQEFVEGREPRCESCGESSAHLGVSHIISVNDCLNDPRYPKELAWSLENFTLECHNQVRDGGLTCHGITEAKSEQSAYYKARQLNIEKKLVIYDRYMPWMAEWVRNAMSLMMLLLFFNSCTISHRILVNYKGEAEQITVTTHVNSYLEIEDDTLLWWCDDHPHRVRYVYRPCESFKVLESVKNWNGKEFKYYPFVPGWGLNTD